ncbi:hypothetical protein [Kordia sp.]|nr:hypothetical protein [Kordia sp.]
MKKKEFKTLKIKKKVISNFDTQKIKGGDTDNSWILTGCCKVQEH